MVFQLDDSLWFPDPHQGEPDGLIAVGGDLSVDRLILAYSNGFFPWYSFRHQHEPMWYCPMQRFVIFPDEIHVSHSMQQLIHQGRYRCTINEDFEGVIQGCATAQNRHTEDGAWLGPQIIRAYTELHRQGFAASVEVWERTDGLCFDAELRNNGGTTSVDLPKPQRRLVGGLYGVNLGSAFFGESMFSLAPNASKQALIHLAHIFSLLGGRLIDCQFETPHLRSMGGRYIPYEEYIDIIQRA